MKKPVIFLAVVGSLIGVGIILSVYGNFLMFDDLTQAEGDVGLGQDLRIESVLNPDENKNGIYAVQIMNFETSSVKVSVLDPSNTEIESPSVNEDLFEGSFDIRTSGTYTLLIENDGEKVKIFGVIGPEPAEWKKSLDWASFVILLIGLVGMVGIAIYIIINRKKD